MAWAIFRKQFNFDHRPLKAVSQFIQPSDAPQSFPERIIAAAVEAGAAERVESPNADEKRAIKRAKRAEAQTDDNHG